DDSLLGASCRRRHRELAKRVRRAGVALDYYVEPGSEAPRTIGNGGGWRALHVPSTDRLSREDQQRIGAGSTGFVPRPATRILLSFQFELRHRHALLCR